MSSATGTANRIAEFWSMNDSQDKILNPLHLPDDEEQRHVEACGGMWSSQSEASPPAGAERLAPAGAHSTQAESPQYSYTGHSYKRKAPAGPQGPCGAP